MSNEHGHDPWAWERIEAMADDSLDRQECRRMLAAMRADARLNAAVNRARVLRGSLRDLNRAPVPADLAAKLLRVVAPHARRSVYWSWLAVPVGAAAVGIATFAILMRQAAPPEPEDPTVAAVREFTVAMTYLQRSAAYTGEEVTGIVNAGLLEALAMGRDSILDEESDDEDGG